MRESNLKGRNGWRWWLYLGVLWKKAQPYLERQPSMQQAGICWPLLRCLLQAVISTCGQLQIFQSKRRHILKFPHVYVMHRIYGLSFSNLLFTDSLQIAHWSQGLLMLHLTGILKKTLAHATRLIKIEASSLRRLGWRGVVFLSTFTVLLWVTDSNCYKHILDFKMFSEQRKKRFQLSARRGARRFYRRFLSSLQNWLILTIQDAADFS